jgi:hypothetical protein
VSGSHSGSALGCKCNECGSYCEDEVVPVPDTDPRAEAEFWKKKARERLARIEALEEDRPDDDAIETAMANLARLATLAEESIQACHELSKQCESYQDVILGFVDWCCKNPTSTALDAMLVLMGAMESAAKAEEEREGTS